MAERQPMSEAEYYILLSILKPNHGYGMMQQIQKRSGGRVKMGPGTLYGALTRMKKQGLILLHEESERKKTYELTENGKKALLEEYERLKKLVSDGSVLEVEE